MYNDEFLETAVNDELYFDLKQKKAADSLKKKKELKKLDKNYQEYTIPFNRIWTDGKYHKYITITNYGSGSTGTLIRNAVTGARYNIVVGSAEQDILFKVCEATGHDGRMEPLMLYYDTPEQYEEHHFTTVSLDVKLKWHSRATEAQKKMGLEPYVPYVIIN